MSDIVQDLESPALVAALEANFVQQCIYYRRAPQAEVYDGPEMTWYNSGIPLAEYNGVCRTALPTDLGPDGIHAAIGRTLTHFGACGTPVMWVLGPSTQPGDLGAYLPAHGLAYGGKAPGMAVELRSLREESSLPAGLTIDRIDSLELLRRWVEVAGAGYGESAAVQRARFEVHAGLGLDADLPLRRYVAELDGEPVAIASLFLGAGVAGVYEVLTVPRRRRRGIGTAITLAALREARDLGYRVGVLVASPLGLPVYRRLGFRECCTLGYYVQAS